ncbi:TPA: hypothetical protein R8Q36_000151 [Campylobacter jejuni]|uniref:Uncharacterized protein n=1 Tax=Campylobacter jejuni TaxID=197 RepID=A0AAX1Z1L4_CAMJU|nr:hypothetical protein [Campylobacter jejuni]EAB5261419.1 hypothetical protein [Campylobacter jejuni]EAH4888038.1 hypothetical protein [Campylobacter jejuni]EAH5551802.1 hypothetical protein [Campylobacter jejuni]EAH7518929.1 hypothetical protein [Campylobacter jejuni]EAH7790982.1 hypothetical protein [Campylobacter jejuni]
MLKMIKIQKVKSLLDLIKQSLKIKNQTNTKENLNETHYLTI